MNTSSAVESTVSVCQHTLRQSTQWQNREWRRRRADRLVVHPAEANSGLHFMFHGAAPTRGTVPARWDAVVETRGETVLGNGRGTTLRGAIPLLAALHVARVDNAVVEVHGSRLPDEVRDFHFYLDLLADAGVQAQSAARRLLRVVDKVEVHDSYGFITLSPAAEFHAAVELPEIQPGGPTHTTCGVLFSNLDNPRVEDRAPAAGSGAVPAATHGSVALARQLWEITALPETLQSRMIELLGHVALAGAPLAGHIRVHESGPPLYQALLHAVVEHHAVVSTTVDAHRARNNVTVRGGTGPVSCATFGSSR